MAFCGFLLQLRSTELMPVEEKKRPYVFSSQTHWLLRLPTNRRKLSRAGPGAPARVEHGRAVGHAPSLGTVGSADAFGSSLLRETGGHRCAGCRPDRTRAGAAGRSGSGL